MNQHSKNQDLCDEGPATRVPPANVVARPPWGKRITFLLLWLLVLSRDLLHGLALSSIGPPWSTYVEVLISRRALLLMFAAAVLIFARFRLLRALGQAIYFLVFIPTAILYAGYLTVRLLLRVPVAARRLMTSPRVHAVLWSSTIIAILGVLGGWESGLLPIYLAVILVAVSALVALAFLFAFSPGALHRAASRVLLEIWKYSQRDLNRSFASGDYLRDGAKRDAKIRELTSYADYAAKFVDYFLRAADPKRAIKIFVVILPLLLGTMIFLFAVAFRALFEIDPANFANSPSGLLDLLLFSVSNTFSAELPGVVPASYAAKILVVFQVLCSVAIGVVLLLVIAAFSPERYREELTEIVNELKSTEEELGEVLARLKSTGAS